MPSRSASISSSQSSPGPKPLMTIRTTQVPSSRAVTSHSVASVVDCPPADQGASVAKRCGAS